MAHTFTNILLHIVFSTKERQPFLKPEIRSEMHAYLAAVVHGSGSEAFAVGGGFDHVHLLISAPRTKTLADFMRNLKVKSSRWARQWAPGFAWQTGYAAFSVSWSKRDSVIEYTHNQERHHRRRSFEDEFVSLLKKNEIEYEERYLWG